MSSSLGESFQNMIEHNSADDEKSFSQGTQGKRRRAMRFRKAVIGKNAFVDQLETKLDQMNFRISWVDNALTEWQNRQNVDTIRPELTERTAKDYIRYFVDRVHENVCAFIGLYGKLAGPILTLRFFIGVLDDGIWKNETTKKITHLGAPLVFFLGIFVFGLYQRFYFSTRIFFWSLPALGVTIGTCSVAMYLSSKKLLSLYFQSQKNKQQALAYRRMGHRPKAEKQNFLQTFIVNVMKILSKIFSEKKKKSSKEIGICSILFAYLFHWLLLIAPMVYLSFHSIMAHPIYGIFVSIILAIMFSKNLSRLEVLPIVRLLSLVLFFSIFFIHTNLGSILVENAVAKLWHVRESFQSIIKLTLYDYDISGFNSLFLNVVVQSFGIAGAIGVFYFWDLQIKIFPLLDHIGRNVTHSGILMTLFVLSAPYHNICSFIILVEPYINALTQHEIFTLMLLMQAYSSIPLVTSVYITYGINVEILMASSSIALLSCLIIAKIWYPECKVQPDYDILKTYLIKYKACKNTVDAFCNGSISAVKLNILYFMCLIVSLTLRELFNKFVDFVYMVLKCVLPVSLINVENYVLAIFAPVLMVAGLEFPNALVAAHLMLQSFLGDGNKAMATFFEQNLNVRWVAECWMSISGNKIFQANNNVYFLDSNGEVQHQLQGKILDQLSESIIISLILNCTNLNTLIFIMTLTLSILKQRKDDIWEMYVSVFSATLFVNILTAAVVGSITMIQTVRCDQPSSDKCSTLLNEFKTIPIGEFAFLCKRSVIKDNYLLKDRYSLI